MLKTPAEKFVHTHPTTRYAAGPSAERFIRSVVKQPSRRMEHRGVADVHASLNRDL
jgi:hypothetical protein